MFKLFKKPVHVHCINLEEVENVLTWLRRNDYLANMGKTDYEIIVHTNGPLEREVRIESYTVVIPYDIASKVMKPYTVEESFASIKYSGCCS
jgi:hypothetical protein